MSVIEARKLSKFYQGEGTSTKALGGVSFSINEGEFVAIMGPSGSGKSTLLHILGLLDRPTDGQYFFDAMDTAKLSDIELAQIRNSKMGFVFQAYHLLPRTSVIDNVILPLQYSTIAPGEHVDRAIRALEQVKMEHRMRHTQAQLSGGERQRVAIARALVNNPKVIFADEPTGNLDSKTGKLVMELIDELHQMGRTIVVITHETPTAEYAQRVIKLHDGLIIEDGSARSVHGHYTK